MKLIRVGERGRERTGVLIGDDAYFDVTDEVAEFDEAFFGSGGIARLRRLVGQRPAENAIPLAGQRIGAPIARPHQIICVGLNYADHARETGQQIPVEPVLFSKSPNTLVGPYEDVVIPRGATALDWEVELGVVIGQRTRYLDSPGEAAAHIAGYVVVNDVSERTFQLERGGQWMKGKSAETFNPTGPWLVTPDEISDVRSLQLWLDVNGKRRQTGSTAAMIFDPFYLVYYISQFLVLEPGDLINTGTPPGVGLAATPPVWLNPGDELRLGIDGMGSQRQTVVEFRPENTPGSGDGRRQR